MGIFQNGLTGTNLMSTKNIHLYKEIRKFNNGNYRKFHHKTVISKGPVHFNQMNPTFNAHDTHNLAMVLTLLFIYIIHI